MKVKRTYGFIAIIIAMLGASPWPLAADTPPANVAPSSPEPASPEPASPEPVDTEPVNTEPVTGPWHEGVAPMDKTAAMILFDDAVRLQRQWLLPDAAARYEQALANWDHPKIRFYLSRVQEQMGDMVAAYENLRLSLRWGLDAFPPPDAEMAREMLRLLEAELSRIEVRCDEPGAEVFLDGKPWFVGPGRKQATVRPGEHVIIARKAGFSTVTRSISLVPGKQARVDIWLSPETIIRGRWERWQPWHTWAVVGTGAALALAGGVLEWQAARDYGQYEQRFRAVCNEQPRCTPHQDDDDLAGVRDHARWKNQGAIAAFTAAGVVLTAAAALSWLDRPRPHRNQDTGGFDIKLAPLVTTDSVSLSLGGSF